MTIMEAVATAPLDTSVRTADTTRTSAYDRLVQRLQDHGSRSNATNTSFQCPAHDDGSPSLHVTPISAAKARNHKGHVLAYCHGGCDLRDVLAAIGMTMTDLYDDEPTRSHTRPVVPSPRRPPVRDRWLQDYIRACTTDFDAVKAAIARKEPVSVTNSPRTAEQLRDGGVATVYIHDDYFPELHHPEYPDWACGGHVVLVWDDLFAVPGRRNAVRKWLLEAAVDVEVLPA